MQIVIANDLKKILTYCHNSKSGDVFLDGKREFVEPEVFYDRDICRKPSEGIGRIGTFHTHPFPYYISPSPMDANVALQQDDLISCTGTYDEEEGICN